MVNNIPQISFGAIKGIAKVNKTDTTGDSINIPDREKLTISGDQDQMKLSSNLSKAYADIQITRVDNSSSLELKEKAKVNIDTIENGEVSLYQESNAGINKADKANIRQENNSKLSIDNLNNSRILLTGHSAANINSVSGDKLTSRVFLLNNSQLHADTLDKAEVIQIDNSKSTIGTLTSNNVLKLADKSRSVIDKASPGSIIFPDSIKTKVEIKQDNRTLKEKLLTKLAPILKYQIYYQKNKDQQIF